MRLSQYLAENDIGKAAFADLIGVSIQAVYRYANGERIPTPDIMRQIKAATEGKVTPNDFYCTEAA
jgi:DNA-binding transcriptional regulator YdaS (Cro superfamily)